MQLSGTVVATCLVFHATSCPIIIQVKRARRLPEQVVLSMDLTDPQVSEMVDFGSLHLPKASSAPQQQYILFWYLMHLTGFVVVQ